MYYIRKRWSSGKLILQKRQLNIRIKDTFVKINNHLFSFFKLPMSEILVSQWI